MAATLLALYVKTGVENALYKQARGSFDYRSSNDVILIRWNDNTVVTIAVNFGSVVEGKVPRWSNAEKKKVLFTRPTLFQCYNQGMGGVDKIDQQIACYRTRNRAYVSENGGGQFSYIYLTQQW
jgi:Transposase IS4